MAGSTETLGSAGFRRGAAGSGRPARSARAAASLAPDLEARLAAIELDDSDVLKLLGARLMALLFVIRSSGVAAFKDGADVSNIDLRLVSVLGRLGPKSTDQISKALGKGKPQVSRSTASLLERGLITRETPRSCFELTASGGRLFRRLQILSGERRKIITRGIPDDAIREAMAILAELTRMTEQLLAPGQDSEAATGYDDEAYIAAAVDVVDEDALIPSIVTLAVLFKRHAVYRWKRLVGISFFDWVVLSRIAEAGGLRQSDLVSLIRRDKGQVSRTVNSLVMQKLLERLRVPGSRGAILKPTARGAAVYERTVQDGRDMDRMVVGQLSPQRRRFIRGLVEIMIDNASALLPSSPAE